MSSSIQINTKGPWHTYKLARKKIFFCCKCNICKYTWDPHCHVNAPLIYVVPSSKLKLRLNFHTTARGSRYNFISLKVIVTIQIIYCVSEVQEHPVHQSLIDNNVIKPELKQAYKVFFQCELQAQALSAACLAATTSLNCPNSKLSGF